MARNPNEIIDNEPMTGFQWGIVAIMVGLNALDGFDVLSIAYASPGIAAEWGIKRDALGIVLSMELVGMAVGSLLLGGLTDMIGRRRMILSCLVVMAGGMFAASTAHNVETLSVYRVITGLGIGGMLAAINAAAAEAANLRRRALAVVIMAAGYPVGSVIGGSISGVLLQYYDWRAVFVFGSLATLAFIPIVLWRAPESIAFEIKRGGAGALERINKTLRRMGHDEADVMPEPVIRAKKLGLGALFSGNYGVLAGVLAFTYFAHIITFYYIIKWIPKLVVDLGFAPASAANVLVAASIGGALGALALGLLTLKARVTGLTMASMFLATVFVIVFGLGWKGLDQITIAAAVAGFFTNAPIVGLYAIVAQAFPTELRGSATGFVIGIGRGGSALAPWLAGLLFATGFDLLTVSILLGLGSTVAALALFTIRDRVAAAFA